LLGHCVAGPRAAAGPHGSALRRAASWLRDRLKRTTAKAKEGGGRAVAHPSGDWPGAACRGVTVAAGGRGWCGARGRADVAMLRAPGSLGRARGGPAKAARGSVRPEVPRWPAIARGRLTGCGCSGPNSGGARAWRREQGLGDRPCTGAELLQGPVGAGLQRSSVPAGEQGRRAAEQGGRGAWTSAAATG
jgi:hypothetical protein